MNDDAIRVAVAEACGWQHIEPKHIAAGDVEPAWGRDARFPHFNFVHQLPNYTKDLNAMHEAEKVLDERQQDVYAGFLGELTGGAVRDFGAMRINATTAVVSATARQRCEALLRTLGKWKE